MKRQRSYGDGLDDDRRRFYDRGPPPPPPQRRGDYEGDGFDRRKGFGGGGFYDHRYRESPSPRGYGVDRAMHRSDSFSGFRREFPKGSRSERDRSRRDGGSSSAWRRPSSGWRDSEGLDGYRALPRRPAVSPSTPPRRSPSEPSRRSEGSKVDKLRKQSCSVSEMEEGEVAPDPEPGAAEHRKQIESSRLKEKRPERSDVKKVEFGTRRNSGTQGKGMTSAPAADNAGKEEGKIKYVMVINEGQITNTMNGNLESDVAEKVGGGDGVPVQGGDANAVDHVGLSTSSNTQKDFLQEEVVTQGETANATDTVGKCTSSSILKDAIQEEVTTLDEAANAAAEVGQSTSSGVQQEAPQEVVAALDETTNTVDAVGMGSSSGMLQEDLKEEAGDVISNAVGRIEVGTSSGLLQGTVQEEMMSQDEAACDVDTLVQVDSCCILEEAMHEEERLLGGTIKIINVVGQGNPSHTLEEAKVIMAEGITSALDIAGKSNSSTSLQEEVMTSRYLHAEEIKETEKGTMADKKVSESTEFVASQPLEERFEGGCCENRVELDEKITEEAAVELGTIEKRAKDFDLEAKPVGANVFHQRTREHTRDSKEQGMALNLIMEKPRTEEKGKGIAFDVLSKEENIGGISAGRAFDLIVQPDIDQLEALKSNGASVKQENETLKVGKLDLSLSLSGGLQNPELKYSIRRTDSLAHATCSQSLPISSFHTNSDGFMASMSMTNSQTFVHNPSCSLTQQPIDNYEHSVGSKPLFQGVAQLSNESTKKGEATPLLQKVFHNGHAPANTSVGVNLQNNGISNDLQRRAGIPGILSPSHSQIPDILPPAHSRGSHDPGLGNSKHRRQLKREKSTSSLTRGERQEGEQLVLNGAGVIERIISKIVSEPLHHTGRMLQEMTSNSVTYLREAISEILVEADKRGQTIALQEALKRRSDLNSEMLQRCPKVLLEILVAIRTGLTDFIKKSSCITTSDLVDIFLNLKCRNLSCQNVLPVDGCDCKICQRKSGFCSSCMCILCLKFDMASNTCSWVGCDVCLHWCHTDCGLHHSLIRKGGSGSRGHNTNEMQFHCAACGHPSEMFGFVKEVFRTCVKQWRIETLIRELQYVERIFSASDDVRGKSVRDFVKQMLIKLENKAYYPEVVKYVTAFFSDDDSNLGSVPSVPLKGIPCSIAEGIDGIPTSSRKATWLPSVTLEGVPFLEKAGAVCTGTPSTLRKMGEAEFQGVDSKPVVDELDGLIKLKQAEANLYQGRANDARKEADSLKHIAMLKYARIEEHYAAQMAKLHINELHESRKQKIEELQVIERTHHQFLSMKTRMETNIRELLLKMEATKQNLSS